MCKIQLFLILTILCKFIQPWTNFQRHHPYRQREQYHRFTYYKSPAAHYIDTRMFYPQLTKGRSAALFVRAFKNPFLREGASVRYGGRPMEPASAYDGTRILMEAMHRFL